MEILISHPKRRLKSRPQNSNILTVKAITKKHAKHTVSLSRKGPFCETSNKKKVFRKKGIPDSNRIFKTKAMLVWKISAVICKQKFLYVNKILQYIWNYKYRNTEQLHFRKLFWSLHRQRKSWS